MNNADIGCLLLHGLTGEPFEMLPLAEQLENLGCQVATPMLPGHGQTPEVLNRTGFEDWIGAALDEFDALCARCRRVYVMGLSMGGSLALRIATLRDPAGLVTIAAPVFLYKFFPWRGKDRRLPLVPLLKHVRPLWPAPPSNPEAREIAPWKGCEGAACLRALDSFMKGLRPLRRDLGRITAPILAVHCPDDRTAPSENAWEIIRNVSSTYRRLALLPVEEQVTRRHVLTTHVETRDEVARLVLEFLRDIENRA